MVWVIRISVVLVGLLAATSATAQANVKTKLMVRFEGFPRGMTCDVRDSFVPVIHSMRDGAPRVLLTSFPSVGEIFCVMPGGQRIVSDVNQRLRRGARAVGVTVFPDGRAVMTTSVIGGLIRDDLTNAIEAG